MQAHLTERTTFPSASSDRGRPHAPCHLVQIPWALLRPIALGPHRKQSAGTTLLATAALATGFTVALALAGTSLVGLFWAMLPIVAGRQYKLNRLSIDGRSFLSRSSPVLLRLCGDAALARTAVADAAMTLRTGSGAKVVLVGAAAVTFPLSKHYNFGWLGVVALFLGWTASMRVVFHHSFSERLPIPLPSRVAAFQQVAKMPLELDKAKQVYEDVEGPGGI